MGNEPTTTGVCACRVTIVEDNEDTRDMLCTLLRLNGHEVSVAEDGEQGLDLICHQRPDVALIDIGLPKMDGYQLVRSLRANIATRDLCLVALTGYGQPEDRQRALDVGFNAHLVKPLRFEELLEVLRQVTG